MEHRNYTEEEVQDLTDRVFLLKEQLDTGKMHFAEHLVDDFVRSYRAIRLRPDGRVDPNTIDGRIRAATLAIRAMKYREESKQQTSLGQIQEAYFDFLFHQFGWLYDRMIQVGATPSQTARAMSRDEKFVKQAVGGLVEFGGRLSEFWQAVGDAATFHLQDGRQLKATFAGDLFPAHWENVVSRAGLYVDTIIIPCPISRIAPLVEILPDKEVAALLVKHVLTAMSYRALATADVSPPIVLVVPGEDDVDREKRLGLVERSNQAVLSHAKHLFGRPFESLEHLMEFCGRLHTIEDVMKELKGRDRLLFDTEWDPGPEAQLARAMAERNPTVPGSDRTIAGHYVFSAIAGRMPQAMGAQQNALRFGGTPFINAETSWLYYTWLLEYEGGEPPSRQGDRQSMHIVHALASEAENNLEWLGNVPPETVLEIRKQGQMEELRAILSEGVGHLIGIDPNNYFRTADQVVENLDRAFREHQKKVAEARQKKLKLYGIDVASCVAVGSVAVAAALVAHPALGAISGVLGVAGLPTLKDIKTRFKEIAAEDEARRLSPTGLLFRHLRS